MISIEEQKNLLLDIARRIKKQMMIYAIGGTAMMFYGLKETTKDIDLIFLNQKERDEFMNAAKQIGWNYLNPELVYGDRENKPIMLKFGESRLDLFVKEVISFTFSEEMQKRAITIRQFEKNLIVKIADIHDIILMKCAADRIRDVDDVKTIVENKEIDFDILIREAKNQLALGKERTIMELGYFLEKLKKLGTAIPDKILDELWEIMKKQIKDKQKEEKLKKRK